MKRILFVNLIILLISSQVLAYQWPIDNRLENDFWKDSKNLDDFKVFKNLKNLSEKDKISFKKRIYNKIEDFRKKQKISGIIYFDKQQKITATLGEYRSPSKKALLKNPQAPGHLHAGVDMKPIEFIVDSSERYPIGTKVYSVQDGYILLGESSIIQEGYASYVRVMTEDKIFNYIHIEPDPKLVEMWEEAKGKADVLIIKAGQLLGEIKELDAPHLHFEERGFKKD